MALNKVITNEGCQIPNMKDMLQRTGSIYIFQGDLRVDKSPMAIREFLPEERARIQRTPVQNMRSIHRRFVIPRTG